MYKFEYDKKLLAHNSTKKKRKKKIIQEPLEIYANLITIRKKCS